jgi:FMN phosphatase YigB (HAD superfamily)
MNLHDKLILTDADGVLLAWEMAFDEWAHQKGYKKEREDIYGMDECYGISEDEAQYLIDRFNQGAWIGWLSPHRDAYKYVRKLHEEHGFVFRVITSFEKDLYSVRLRQMNLHNTFGANVFESIYCIGDEDKADYLEPYRDTGCIWLEDKKSNCLKGVQRGLNCFLFEHPYNKDFEHPEVTRVKTWKELYHHIT